MDIKKTLSQQIEDKLYQMIVTEEQFAPGDKLPNENELSDTLGVSRTTLREAIRSLTVQGVLEIHRGKGTFISKDMHLYDNNLDFKSLERLRVRLKDLFEIRLIFEPETTYLACKRATDKELKDILDKGHYEEELIRSGQNRVVADQEFHQAIVLASHNEYMIRLIPMINKAVDVAIHTTTDSQGLSQYTLQDHALLMDFLEARDPKGAKYAMTLHIHHAMRLLGIAEED